MWWYEGHVHALWRRRRVIAVVAAAAAALTLALVAIRHPGSGGPRPTVAAGTPSLAPTPAQVVVTGEGFSLRVPSDWHVTSVSSCALPGFGDFVCLSVGLIRGQKTSGWGEDELFISWSRGRSPIALGGSLGCAAVAQTTITVGGQEFPAARWSCDSHVCCQPVELDTSFVHGSGSEGWTYSVSWQSNPDADSAYAAVLATWKWDDGRPASPAPSLSPAVSSSPIAHPTP